MRGNSMGRQRMRRLTLFQFTPLHERQPDPTASCAVGHLFQFTPLHERQRHIGGRPLGRKYFNSRLYMRGNYVEAGVRRVYRISIHASTWEATVRTGKNHEGYSISIHASTWEATCCKEVGKGIYQFQFTPLHERQLTAEYAFLISIQFQFTPLHERQQER